MDVLGKDRLVLEPLGKPTSGRFANALIVSFLVALAALQTMWWFLSR
jgi:hypothetical protein